MEEFDFNKPFVLYRLPGEVEINLRTNVTLNNSSLQAGDVSICSWLNQPICAMSVEIDSTDFATYSGMVTEAASRSLRRSGKTVIVREICGEFKCPSPIAMADEYFAKFPDMFCFLFYHPSTGYWMGASPELLVTFDGSEGSTRALAGTRRLSSHEAWSEKNIDEHNMVVEDIKNNISQLGTDWESHSAPTGTLQYGDIEHLCTAISVKYNGSDKPCISTLVSALHPTAAIGGFPRKEALEDIAELETRPRKFYAGVICTATTAYVILRCVHFDHNRLCVYTGSGITGLSEPEDEWLETQAKATPLTSLLTKYQLS